ncbi:MAG: DUF1761 domain-containing protein [Candidatus Saccharimonadales bacterium]|nr:DUF1761 domain-containing protein [Candidatus Saccharimonadales bacterium]
MDLEWLTEALGEVDVLAAVVAILATMVLGAIWYAPQVFGEVWRKEAGLSKKAMEDKEGMATMYAGMIVLNLFTVWFLGATLIGTGVVEVLDATILGAVFGLVFAAFPHAVHAFFERKSVTYMALTGGHNILNFAVMALVLAVFGL